MPESFSDMSGDSLVDADGLQLFHKGLSRIWNRDICSMEKFIIGPS